jgi:hypothetical protein
VAGDPRQPAPQCEQPPTPSEGPFVTYGFDIQENRVEAEAVVWGKSDEPEERSGRCPESGIGEHWLLERDVVPVRAGALVCVVAAGPDLCLVREVKTHCTVWVGRDALVHPAPSVQA